MLKCCQMYFVRHYRYAGDVSAPLSCAIEWSTSYSCSLAAVPAKTRSTKWGSCCFSLAVVRERGGWANAPKHWIEALKKSCYVHLKGQWHHILNYGPWLDFQAIFLTTPPCCDSWGSVSNFVISFVCSLIRVGIGAEKTCFTKWKCKHVLMPESTSNKDTFSFS